MRSENQPRKESNYRHRDNRRYEVACDTIRHALNRRARALRVGDHFNDLPMLQRHRAAWLAAPANAIPPVQEVVREQGGYISRLQMGEGVSEALAWCLDETRH